MRTQTAHFTLSLVLFASEALSFCTSGRKGDSAKNFQLKRNGELGESEFFILSDFSGKPAAASYNLSLSH